MSETDMSTKYDPTTVEAGMYKKWRDAGYFKPSGNPEAKPYSIVIPPPNVTGKLHMGHAWDTTFQDMIIRQKRMQGFDTLWLPGMDHAGIATQAKVEAKLRKQGVSRYDLGRDKFIQQVWEWKDEYAKTIHEQWAKMGLSLDYSRERFTLDKGLSKAVRKVFVDLYNEGLIYRGQYIINWDPELRTALSDIEVLHQDDQGAFYHVKYPYVDGSGYIEIATTRPETMLGDTAIAVHPDDERYQAVVGKEVILPLVGRKIPIIADRYVDMQFGTGAVKITPAHDPNDFEVGNRHNLERINIMNDDATINDQGGKYAGMDRFEARKAIVADLKKEGYLLSVEPIVHSVGHSERSGVQVEPRLSTQWFVKMKPLAKRVLDQQKTDDKVHFVPERFEHTLINWMENIHDWVISRQLWWGHRIPAWYNKETGKIYVGMDAPEDPENWEQDPDVLDTWFSSALWPFSTLGWPDTQAPDYKRYFPTNTLVTGYDIIPFWVARMIFQSEHFTNQRPFDHALIHGLMRDSQGRKMSKSLGNGIDPMDIISKYGADALRWYLSTSSTPGQDANFSEQKLEAAWNFINKIWNISRFVLMNLADTPASNTPPDPQTFDLADRWIFFRLNETIKKVTRLTDQFEFGEAGRALYNFTWNDFADWYVEMSKEVLYGTDETKKSEKRRNLLWVLDMTLRMLHPTMPFVTEKIWQAMPHAGETIMLAQYPLAHDQFADASAAADMDWIIALVRSVRNIRSQANAPLSKPIRLQVYLAEERLGQVFNANKPFIQRFVNASDMETLTGTQPAASAKVMTAVIPGGEVIIPLTELVDMHAEIERLSKEHDHLQQEVDRANKKLANQGFVAKAPAAVVAAEKQKLAEYQEQLKTLTKRLADLRENDA
ncbi:valine--tRNA ligase [Schleiferilactobacillus perolens]|uniref:Valine--tRNA ligase n=1 Tax=Schleiferilactobacillus perolens DSM 12744 TaxID=1423792 RepID=A0A0R1N9M2_9LACO|nr:valine--tRNA ligase [Schleiferilactobacillus perolens]KRL14234.1 valyl-tRNA synthetase [Schleiferilactobacillus perolens DSM 12744]